MEETHIKFKKKGMLKKILIVSAICCILVPSFAQKDSTKKSSTTITAYVDGYYRALIKEGGGSNNNLTSFTNSHNAFKLGMASVKVDQAIGKFTASLDLGAGKRADEFSYNDHDVLTNIKQATLSYAVSNKLKLTAGKFATHIGYELLDATSNRNYSMSYGFSYSPYFHTGFKADIALGKKTAMMVGLVDPNDYSSFNGKPKYVIAQLSLATSNDKLKGYLNFVHGDNTTQYNLILLTSVSSKVSAVYDVSTNQQKNGATYSSWSTNAFYINYDISEKFGLTVRQDFFSDRKINPLGLGNVNATTFSGKIKVKKLTLIPEFRMDSGNTPLFNTKTGTASSASNFLLAAVYAF
jgi:hypothetical protein